MKLDPDALRRLPPFATLPPDALEALVLCFRERRFATGELVFREGDPAAGLLFVAQGELSVSAHEGGAVVSRGRVRAGEILGETALIDPSPRPISVKAERSSILFEIGEDSVTILRRSAPAAARALTTAAIVGVTRRLRRLSRRVEQALEREGLLP